MRAYVWLITLGTSLIAWGGGWYLTSRPSEREVNTAQASNYLTGRTGVPAAEVAGPIVFAVAGAFLVLVGVILYAAGQQQTKTAPIPPAPNLVRSSAAYDAGVSNTRHRDGA